MAGRNCLNQVLIFTRHSLYGKRRNEIVNNMEYGKLSKRISFIDTDKRNADFLIRLKHDGLTKTKFFRIILTGYLERDEDIVSFIKKQEESSNSKNKKQITEKLEEKGRESKEKFGLDSDDIKNIFDLLEKENPDL